MIRAVDLMDPRIFLRERKMDDKLASPIVSAAEGFHTPLCISTSREAASGRCRGLLGLARRSLNLHEHVEHFGEHFGGNAHAIIATRIRASPSSRSTARLIWPSGGVYIAELLSKFATTCASRVRSPMTNIASEGSTTASW